MIRHCLWICLITATALSCKTTNSGSTSTVKELSKLPVCYGDRKFLATDGFGFNFSAAAVPLNNAYWAALASAVAYNSGADNKMMISDWGKTSLKSFQFFGEPANSTGTEGYLAEFAHGNLIVFRGTANGRDVLTDLDRTKFRGKAFNRDGVLEELKIHKGFWNAADIVWNPIINSILKSSPLSDLPVTSPDAFALVNRVFRGVIQEADIERFNPNQHFLPELKLLQGKGIIKNDANLSELLAVLNIWAEEAMLASRAYAAGSKADDMAKFNAVVANGMRRKQKNFPRIHKFFNYRSFKPIWLTGHSLGAALSTVFSYRMMKMGIPVQGLITFGSPRVGNDVFEYFVETSFQEDGKLLNLLRFQNDNDGVTRIPKVNGWRHVGDPWFIAGDKRLFVRSPAPELNNTLVSGLSRFPANADVLFYHSELPPGYRGIWTFDLLEFIGDHAMGSQYGSTVERYVFGKKAPGCP